MVLAGIGSAAWYRPDISSAAARRQDSGSATPVRRRNRTGTHLRLELLGLESLDSLPKGAE